MATLAKELDTGRVGLFPGARCAVPDQV